MFILYDDIIDGILKIGIIVLYNVLVSAVE